VGKHIKSAPPFKTCSIWALAWIQLVAQRSYFEISLFKQNWHCESREAAINTTIVISWAGKCVAVAETSGEMAAVCKHYGVLSLNSKFNEIGFN